LGVNVVGEKISDSVRVKLNGRAFVVILSLDKFCNGVGLGAEEKPLHGLKLRVH